MVGGLYIDQGEYRKERSTSGKRPWKCNAASSGRRTRKLWQPCTMLGHCCLYRRDRREATGVLTRVLELRRRVLGDDHDDTLFTARPFAAVCYTPGGPL